jgi:hypothetical protein
VSHPIRQPFELLLLPRVVGLAPFGYGYVGSGHTIQQTGGCYSLTGCLSPSSAMVEPRYSRVPCARSNPSARTKMATRKHEQPVAQIEETNHPSSNAWPWSSMSSAHPPRERLPKAQRVTDLLLVDPCAHTPPPHPSAPPLLPFPSAHPQAGRTVGYRHLHRACGPATTAPQLCAGSTAATVCMAAPVPAFFFFGCGCYSKLRLWCPFCRTLSCCRVSGKPPLPAPASTHSSSNSQSCRYACSVT